MSFEFTSLHGCSIAYRLSHGSLKQRLGPLLPDVDLAHVSITSTDLSSNASFVNYVRHHRLHDPVTGTQLDVVEKSIRKVAFITSLEARFYRERDVLAGSEHFQHPACYGLIETPWESIIFTRYVQGRPPRMRAIAAQVARGIDEIERLSSRHIAASPAWHAFKYWQMDFFRPWYLLRPRFSYARHLADLGELAKVDQRFQGLEAPIRALAPRLKTLARDAARSPRCFSHMDYLRKNLFMSAEGLHLIDWSEVKVGRIGFDAGAYLSGLFRRSDMAAFEKARGEFLKVYADLLPGPAARDDALRNAHYLFLLNSLWHCLRPETADEYRAKDRLPLLREKLGYLIRIA